MATGLLCGIGARAFVWLIAPVKALRGRHSVGLSVAVGGVGLAATAAIGIVAFDEPLTIGPGYDVVRWLLDPARSIWLVLLLFGVRALSTAFTVGGGGVGGLFIPLAVQGALLGRAVASIANVIDPALLPLVGAAAFLGAGYRTPVAAVMFVAESTGTPGFVVPGLLATAISQLVMGGRSISPFQQPVRGGHVEQRFRLNVRAALSSNALVVEVSATVDDLLHRHFVRARARSLPVVDEGRYLGMVRLDDVAGVPREERHSRTVSDVLDAGVPAGTTGWTLRRAIEVMDAADVDQIAIVEADRFRGVVTMADILNLEEILEVTKDRRLWRRRGAATLTAF